jgi:hypothetical protein
MSTLAMLLHTGVAKAPLCNELKEMRQEMREGFASIKSHMTGVVGNVFSHERPILDLEDDVLKLQRKVELSDEAEH